MLVCPKHAFPHLEGGIDATWILEVPLPWCTKINLRTGPRASGDRFRLQAPEWLRPPADGQHPVTGVMAHDCDIVV